MDKNQIMRQIQDMKDELQQAINQEHAALAQETAKKIIELFKNEQLTEDKMENIIRITISGIITQVMGNAKELYK